MRCGESLCPTVEKGERSPRESGWKLINNFHEPDNLGSGTKYRHGGLCLCYSWSFKILTATAMGFGCSWSEGISNLAEGRRTVLPSLPTSFAFWLHFSPRYWISQDINLPYIGMFPPIVDNVAVEQNQVHPHVNLLLGNYRAPAEERGSCVRIHGSWTALALTVWWTKHGSCFQPPSQSGCVRKTKKILLACPLTCQ